MIKQLRIKFICVVMVIVMLMLVGILGVVIHFTKESLETQSLDMMRRVSSEPKFHNFPEQRKEEILLPFFTVRLDRQGQIVSTNSNYFDLTDENAVQEIVDAAFSSQQEHGVLADFNLRYLKDRNHKGPGPEGITIVFADISAETAALRALCCNGIFIFFAAFLVFLGISILLSRWAIRPVARAWEQQRKFVADASHELKTPLSIIMANADLLQNETASEEEQKTFSKNILTTSYQMRSLVENMLEMARVDNDSEKKPFVTLDFSQLVTDAVLSFQLLYEEAALPLLSELEEGIFLRGSEQHLYQVLDVLLDNALKYSSGDGTVVVQLKRAGKNALLFVDSPGEPIPKEHLKDIFKRFYRVDNARTRNGSYGLGLAIADAIVRTHRGKIWAESRPGGNRFCIQLPIG